MNPFKLIKQAISQMAEIARLLKEAKKMKEEHGEIEYTDDQRRRLLEKARKLSPESRK